MLTYHITFQLVNSPLCFRKRWKRSRLFPEGKLSSLELEKKRKEKSLIDRQKSKSRSLHAMSTTSWGEEDTMNADVGVPANFLISVVGTRWKRKYLPPFNAVFMSEVWSKHCCSSFQNIQRVFCSDALPEAEKVKLLDLCRTISNSLS